MTNVEKQEEVVAALWEFAEAQSLRPHDATKTNSVSVNLASVGETAERIMNLFGYEMVRID